MKTFYVVRAHSATAFGGTMWIFTQKSKALAKRNQLKKNRNYCFVRFSTVTEGKAVFN